MDRGRREGGKDVEGGMKGGREGGREGGRKGAGESSRSLQTKLN